MVSLKGGVLMGKVLLVIFLLFSTGVPVYSQEDESEKNDEGSRVVEVDETQEVRELILNKKFYELDNYSRKKIYIDKFSPEGELSFRSLDPKILTVDGDGFMVAKAPGKTSVEVALTFENSEEDLVEIVDVEVLKEDGEIIFSKNEFFLIRGLYFDLEYTLEGKIKSQELIWESSDPSVAVVENGRVTGRKLGSTRITASAKNKSASMVVNVTAPLEDLAFNPDALEMLVGEEKELPSLVYAPYDTTSKKTPDFSLEDNQVVSLDGNLLKAEKVGETILKAKINDITAELSVLVRPNKNIRNADLITLEIDSQDQEQITFKNPDLSLYKNNYFSLHLPVEETKVFLEEKTTLDIFIVLDDVLYQDNMKAIDELILEEEIVALFEGKDIRIHLLDKNNMPQIVYEFSHGFDQAVNLKYSVNELEEHHELFQLVQTHACHLLFSNSNGFPEKTRAKIPAQTLGSHKKILHFVYQINNKELSENIQEVSIDSQEYLNLDLDGDEYIITLSKVSNVDDSKVIVTLSIILFTSLLSGVLFYYYKVHNKN